jgi:Arc/MetJ-type ribon-helix-helix transcriptional regulator
MSLILSPATEARLQRQLETGAYSGPDDLLAHALDLLVEAEAGQGDWLSANRDTVRAMLEESLAAEARGESHSMEEAEAILPTRRDALVARLEESYAQTERGELYTPEQARAILAERRASYQAIPTAHDLR